MSGKPLCAASRRLALVIVWLLGIPAALRADEPAAAGATVSSDPVFSMLLLDGTTHSGRIRQIGPKDELILVPSAGPEEVFPLTKVVKLTRETTANSFSRDGSLILLPEGDRLFRAGSATATDTTLEVQPDALDHLSIPLECVLGIILKQPSDDDARDALINRVRSEPRTSEVLWLANGDRLTGGFLGLDDTKIKFQTENGTLAVEQSGINALGFDPTLVSYPRPAGLVLSLALADGSRLGVSGARVEQGQVSATTRFGAAVKVPLGELVAVHVLSPAVSYLSDRDAFKTQYVAYVGPTRPYHRDESVEGHPFLLAGQVYDRGLGTQSRTFLAYRLVADDQRFQALVGLDDRAGALGSVVFRVLVDGKERFSSPPMSVRDTPRPIDVDVSGAKLLVLVTEFGERGEVRDFADWVEARLVRKVPQGIAP